MTDDTEALIKRYDHLRNSGIMSPTTGELLRDSQKLIEAQDQRIEDGWNRVYVERANTRTEYERRVAAEAERDALAASIAAVRGVLNAEIGWDTPAILKDRIEWALRNEPT